MSEVTETPARHKQAFFVANIIEEFATKKEAEDYVNTHELASDEAILKGRALVTEEQTKVVVLN